MPPVIAVLRAGLFYAGLTLSTLVFTVPAALSRLVPLPVRHRLIGWWSRFNIWWLRVTCGIRHEVVGLENLPDTPAAIVMAKHQSTWETMGLERYFPPLTWVIKRELLRVPGYGWGLAGLEPIAIDRSKGREALNQIVELGLERLHAGRWVLIFPEGTRMPPGAPPKYRAGGARLAAKSGCPVVPVALNSGLFWRHGEFVKQPGTIRVEIGPVIPSEGRTADEILADVRGWIESRMTQLVGQRRD